MVGKLKLDSGKVRSFYIILQHYSQNSLFWGKILIEKLETIKAEKGKKLHTVDFENNRK